MNRAFSRAVDSFAWRWCAHPWPCRVGRKTRVRDFCEFCKGLRRVVLAAQRKRGAR